MPTISLPLPRPASELVPRLRAEAHRHGATWDGDEHAGTVSAMGLTAHYAIVDGTMTVTYKRSPLVPLPKALVRSKLQDLLQSV